MWIYEKKLEYPVSIKRCDLRMSKYLIAQFGGPDGEMSAALRYLSQRYSMPDNRMKAVLTDIGTEELAHWEMIATMVHQCMQGATIAAIEAAGLAPYYTLHGCGVFPCDPNGVPWTAAYIAVTGDPIADLTEDMAAEQKARATYEHLIHLTDDPDVKDPLRFLREREVVHFQRFGEALNIAQGMKLCDEGTCEKKMCEMDAREFC